MTSAVARGVGVRVGTAVLLEGVDLEISPGRLVAIVGPNGAGKTTLLRALAGEIQPSSGAVALDGIPAARLHTTELSLLRSYLHHSTPADIPFTVRQVVALGRHPHRHHPDNSSAADGKAIEQSMSAVDVDRLADRTFASLSGGEQMRASIARVLAQDAPIMFFDEPTAPLDVSHQERVLALLSSLCRSRAVAVVLHDLNAAASHASHLVLLSKGRVVAQGSPGAVLQADRLTAVYGHPMHVMPHPLRPGPLVLAHPAEVSDQRRPVGSPRPR